MMFEQVIRQTGQRHLRKDAERTLANLDVVLSSKMQSLLDTMTIRELARLILALSTASPHNAITHFDEAIAAIELERQSKSDS